MIDTLAAGVRRAHHLWRDDDLRRYALRTRLRPWRTRRHEAGRRSSRPSYLDRPVAPPPTLTQPAVSALLPWGASSIAGPHRLRLAASVIEVDDLSAIPWARRFDDPEDAWALHRFAWLQPWLVDRSDRGAQRGETAALVGAAVRSWLADGSTTEVTGAWQAYTVAERLVNWTIAALAVGESIGAETDQLASMRHQLAHLRRNLEYHGDALTGNHLSNDGRGLYIAGIAAADSDAIAVGRMILIEERRRLFEEPWFARDGSSHYHYLITRNYLDALWFAEQSGDHQLADALRPTVASLVDGCRFFVVRSCDGSARIPLFGDISPDCTPEWLIGIATEDRPSGWRQLFARPTRDDRAASPAIVSREWGRVDADGWTVFTHVNPSGATKYHAHQDTGAIAAYYRGQPILVDGGRSSYRETADGRWGREWRAHSMCVADEINPGPFWHWAYSADDLQALTGAPPTLEVDARAIRIAHEGFRRGNGLGTYQRVASIDDGTLSLVDSIGGAGCHRIDVVLHIPTRIGERRGNDFAFDFPTFRMRIEVPHDLRDCSVYSAPSGHGGFGSVAVRYGLTETVTSLRLSGNSNLPWSGRTSCSIHR